MTAIDLAVKTCTKCDQTKPLSQFYRCKTSRDGLSYWCKTCDRETTDTWREEERERMGEEAWLAYQAEIVRRHRRNNPEARERGRQQVRAYKAAEKRLRLAHLDEFAVYYAEERRERGLP